MRSIITKQYQSIANIGFAFILALSSLTLFSSAFITEDANALGALANSLKASPLTTTAEAGSGTVTISAKAIFDYGFGWTNTQATRNTTSITATVVSGELAATCGSATWSQSVTKNISIGNDIEASFCYRGNILGSQAVNFAATIPTWVSGTKHLLAVTTVTVQDTVSPLAPVGGQPATTATNNFYFTWNPVVDSGSPIVEYQYQASTSSSTDGSNVLNVGVWRNWISGNSEQHFLATPTIHSVGAGDGAWYWQVRAIDAADNIGAWSDVWTTVIDTVAPTATFIFPTPSPSSTSFDVQFNEAVKKTDAENAVNYFLNNWPGAGGSGDLLGDATIVYDESTYVATVTFLNAGWYISPEQQWGVENIHDLAGNLLSPSPTTAYSTPLINPTVPGTPTAVSPTNLTSIDWTWTASTDPAEASGVKGYYYELTQGSTVIVPTTFTTNNYTTTDVLIDGTYTLTVYAIDNAGNIGGSAAGAVVKDTVAPEINYSGSTQNVNNFTPAIAITGHDSFDWVASPSNPAGAIFNSNLMSPIFTVINSGNYSFVVTAVDEAGNESHFDYTFSYTAPPAAVLGGATVNIGGGTSTTPFVAVDSSTSSDDSDGEVKSDSDTAETSTDNASDSNTSGNIFGLAWYWWVVILAGIAGLLWFLMSQRRQD